MKTHTRGRLKDWDIHHFHWQDLLAVLGGAWLVATVPATLVTVNFFVGWLAFIAGALIVLVGAACFRDDSPGLSWAMAIGGLVAIGGAIVAWANEMMVGFWSLLIGGGVVVFFEVWSATLKRRETRRERRRTRAGEPVQA